MVVFSISCAGHSNASHQEREEGKAARGEHARDEGGEGEGEENGTELSLTDEYDQVRNGARLTLKYDKTSNSFIGLVENTTDKALDKVRVEVHLSNGIELGPTKAVSLAPGEKSIVTLKATRQAFTGWTTHAEVGNSEHGGENGEGHEGEEGRGEHGSKEGREGSEHGGA